MQCELNAYGGLPNREFWDWCRDLIEMDAAGARCVVDDALRAMDMGSVRAYLRFRETLDRDTEAARERAAERQVVQ